MTSFLRAAVQPSCKTLLSLCGGYFYLRIPWNCHNSMLPFHYRCKAGKVSSFAPTYRFSPWNTGVFLLSQKLILPKQRADKLWLLTISSALRLCVWLFDDGYLKFFYFNQTIVLTFRAVEWKIFQFCILPHLYPRFISAGRASYPFCFLHNDTSFPSQKSKEF